MEHPPVQSVSHYQHQNKPAVNASPGRSPHTNGSIRKHISPHHHHRPDHHHYHRQHLAIKRHVEGHRGNHHNHHHEMQRHRRPESQSHRREEGGGEHDDHDDESVHKNYEGTDIIVDNADDSTVISALSAGTARPRSRSHHHHRPPPRGQPDVSSSPNSPPRPTMKSSQSSSSSSSNMLSRKQLPQRHVSYSPTGTKHPLPPGRSQSLTHPHRSDTTAPHRQPIRRAMNPDLKTELSRRSLSREMSRNNTSSRVRPIISQDLKEAILRQQQEQSARWREPQTNVLHEALKHEIQTRHRSEERPRAIARSPRSLHKELQRDIQRARLRPQIASPAPIDKPRMNAELLNAIQGSSTRCLERVRALPDGREGVSHRDYHHHHHHQVSIVRERRMRKSHSPPPSHRMDHSKTPKPSPKPSSPSALSPPASPKPPAQEQDDEQSCNSKSTAATDTSSDSDHNKNCNNNNSNISSNNAQKSPRPDHHSKMFPGVQKRKATFTDIPKAQPKTFPSVQKPSPYPSVQKTIPVIPELAQQLKELVSGGDGSQQQPILSRSPPSSSLPPPPRKSESLSPRRSRPNSPRRSDRQARRGRSMSPTPPRYQQRRNHHQHRHQVSSPRSSHSPKRHTLSKSHHEPRKQRLHQHDDDKIMSRSEHYHHKTAPPNSPRVLRKRNPHNPYERMLWNDDENE